MNESVTKTIEKQAQTLKDIIKDNEEWLMESILSYALRQGYTAYTSTLTEAWRLSISGLSASIIDGLENYSNVPELTPEEDFRDDPVALFGIVEAQRHRERGISLNMFLGLMKYYRQSYVDLVRKEMVLNQTLEGSELFVNRIFDRLEIAFCNEWSESKGDTAIHELQVSNRVMTNEKNKYLTIFESIPNPVIILNRGKKIDNMNLAAAKMFKDNLSPGSQYYCSSRDRQLEAEQCLENQTEIDPSCFGGECLSDFLPWINEEIDSYIENDSEASVFEKKVSLNGQPLFYRIKISKSLDVSGKFDGIIIILEDITSLKSALEEVKTLRGFLPICANCKKIRDDEGYWNQIEEYIGDRSEAKFSHSICPECAKKLYPDLDLDL